ncbi:MAG: DUF2182 domain-containing protein [Pseudomonadota bacterium]
MSSQIALPDARGLAWLSFFVVVLAAWAALLAMAATAPSEIERTFWAAICGVGADEAGFGVTFAMWALMVAAMMAPSVLPALRTYDDLIAAGAGRRSGFTALIGGYLLVWFGYAVLGAALQRSFAAFGMIDGDGRLIGATISAALLALAGLYQFSQLKSVCAQQCRAPFLFFMEHWQPGARGGLMLGLRLGLICAGCCWALMLLAFVGGTMSLLWMGLATVLMTVEKLPDYGAPLTRPLGFALLVAAGWAAMGGTLA